MKRVHGRPLCAPSCCNWMVSRPFSFFRVCVFCYTLASYSGGSGFKFQSRSWLTSLSAYGGMEPYVKVGHDSFLSHPYQYVIHWQAGSLGYWQRYIFSESPVVTIWTANLTFSNTTFCPHSVFVCSMWIWEQTVIISVYSIDWLIFITETVSVYCAVRTAFVTINLMFCCPCIIIYQCSKTNVMHFLFSVLRIKGLYIFRALLAHLQEALHIRHLVYCVRVMSVGCMQYTKCRLYGASWRWASNARNM
jgi:hypothetical protein